MYCICLTHLIAPVFRSISWKWFWGYLSIVAYFCNICVRQWVHPLGEVLCANQPVPHQKPSPEIISLSHIYPQWHCPELIIGRFWKQTSSLLQVSTVELLFIYNIIAHQVFSWTVGSTWFGKLNIKFRNSLSHLPWFPFQKIFGNSE